MENAGNAGIQQNHAVSLLIPVNNDDDIEETKATVKDANKIDSLFQQESSNYDRIIITKSVRDYPSDPTLNISKRGLREKLQKAFSSQRFQVFVISFTILDCIIVISELLMDLRLLSLESSHGINSLNESHYCIPDILHVLSLSLLALFLLEVTVKIIATHCQIFLQKWELFDIIIVVVTITLEAVFQHSHSAATGFGLLIILRLWRVAQILNGIVSSVRSRADRYLECERRRREAAMEQLEQLQSLCHKQQDQIAQLEKFICDLQNNSNL